MATRQSQSIYDTNPSSLPVGQLRDADWKVPAHPFSQVFGDPRGRETSTYDVSDKTTWTLPDAYWGQSKKLSDTIERWVFTDDNFYLQNIMPFEVVQDANYVVWNEIHFGESLTTPVPELGVVRLVKASRKQNTASWLRWGIGYYMEHGFMNTPVGIQYHIEHLQQMASAALETAKFDVIYTLLQAQDIEKRWEIEHGKFTGARLEDVIANDIWMFASLQKYKRPINELEVHVRETMSKWGGRADSWILPPQIINYLSIEPDEYLEQRKFGALGPSIVEDGPRPYGMIAQSKVYIARTYHTATVTGRENLLEHQREIGEYYKMFPLDPERITNYRSKHRNIKIYNEDQNQWFEVGLRWALDNSHLFDAATGLPKRMSEGRYQHRMEGDDAEFDIWRYVDVSADGTRAQHYESELLGEMPLPYFDARDKLTWAGTARNKMKQQLGERSFQTLENDFREGLDLLREIEAIPWSAANETAILARFAGAGSAQEQPSRPRDAVGAVFNLPEWSQEATTGFLKSQAAALTLLLPGMQSYAGLRHLVLTGGPKLQREVGIARRFLNAIDNFVASAKRLALGSVFLSANHSSPWWHNPTDATTFFENLVMPYRPPVFMSTDEELGASDEGGTTAAAVLTPPIEQLKAGLGERLKIAPAPPGGNKLAWLRYYLITAVAATAANPTDAQADVIVEAFGGTAGKDEAPAPIFDFATPLAGNSQNAEVNEIVRRYAALGAQLPDVFPGLKDIEIASQVVTTTVGHFEESWTTVGAAAAPGVRRPANYASYYRTPLLASPAFAASLAGHYRDAGADSTRLLPADPDFPEHVISPEKLAAYTTHLPGSGSSAAERRDASSFEALSRVNPAWHARIGEHSTGSDIESTTLMATALAAHIGQSLDANDFGGSSIASNIGSQAVPGSALTSPDQNMFPRRAAKAYALKGTINPALLPYEYRADLSPAMQRHIGHGERMRSSNFARSWQEINRIAPSPIDRALAHIFDGTPIHYDAFMGFIDNDLTFPLGFYLARPHMTYRMLFGIKCLAGKEMGMTLMKPGLFEIGDDAATQAHLGTYTYYSKALVKNHNHVYIAKSIFCSGYDGGTGIQPINPDIYEAADGNYGGQSIVVIGTAYRDNNDGIMSLTGRLTLGEYAEYGLSLDNELWYITAPRYNKVYGWNWARVETRWETQPYDGIVDRRFNNVLCFPGHQFYYDPLREEFTIVTVGSGHFAGNTYLGCDKARRGLNQRFKEPEWSGYVRV